MARPERQSFEQSAPRVIDTGNGSLSLAVNSTVRYSSNVGQDKWPDNSVGMGLLMSPLSCTVIAFVAGRYNVGSVACALILGAFSFLIGWSLWQRWRVRNANTWPSTEATIEPTVHFSTQDQYGLNSMPTFAFSYEVNGEYYGGRFSLRPYIADPGKSLFETMKGRKLQIRYDPREPKVWFIPDKLIEGCKIEQWIDDPPLALSRKYWN